LRSKPQATRQTHHPKTRYEPAEKGRLGWQRAVGYGKRSLVEVAMLRQKVLIGRGLRARTLPAQKTEAAVGCRLLNVMTGLAMPLSRLVA
jgi:hypothetical protein